MCWPAFARNSSSLSCSSIGTQSHLPGCALHRDFEPSGTGNKLSPECAAGERQSAVRTSRNAVSVRDAGCARSNSRDLGGWKFSMHRQPEGLRSASGAAIESVRKEAGRPAWSRRSGRPLHARACDELNFRSAGRRSPHRCLRFSRARAGRKKVAETLFVDGWIDRTRVPCRFFPNCRVFSALRLLARRAGEPLPNRRPSARPPFDSLDFRKYRCYLCARGRHPPYDSRPA